MGQSCTRTSVSLSYKSSSSTFHAQVCHSLGSELKEIIVTREIVVSLLVFVAVGIYSRRVKNRRMYIMALATLPPFVGMLGMSLLPSTSEYKWTKWGLYLITVPYVLALFLAWTLIPSNVAGRTKKTLISSATFIGYVSVPASIIILRIANRSSALAICAVVRSSRPQMRHSIFQARLEVQSALAQSSS